MHEILILKNDKKNPHLLFYIAVKISKVHVALKIAVFVIQT